jgi:hypothetical protein
MFAGAEACTRIASRAETCPATKKRMAETCQTRAEVEVDDVHECMTL